MEGPDVFHLFSIFILHKNIEKFVFSDSPPTNGLIGKPEIRHLIDFFFDHYQNILLKIGEIPCKPLTAVGKTCRSGQPRSRADDHGDVPLNTSGHSFLTITNVSEQDINVGGLLIAPDTSITVSTRGNRCEHSGIWYNLEGYYKYYLNASYYQNLYGIQVSLDQSQLDTVNQALANADHWSAIYNCTSFSAGLWNAVCSDTLCAGVPETPADLKADMLRKYPDKTVFGPTVPYDYIVYYGTSLTPSQEFS